MRFRHGAFTKPWRLLSCKRRQPRCSRAQRRAAAAKRVLGGGTSERLEVEPSTEIKCRPARGGGIIRGGGAPDPGRALGLPPSPRQAGDGAGAQTR